VRKTDTKRIRYTFIENPGGSWKKHLDKDVWIKFKPINLEK